MSEFLADLDLKTIGVIGLCLLLGFFMAWTFLSARSDDRRDEQSKTPASSSDDPHEGKGGRI